MFFSKIGNLLTKNDFLKQLIKGGLSSFILIISFAILSFFISTMLARMLGTQGYGAYANAMAWVSILATMAPFGFDILLVRDVAILNSQARWPVLKGFLQFSHAFVLGSSSLMIGFVFILARIIYVTPDKQNLLFTLLIGALLIPLNALGSLQEGAMRGLENVNRALLPDMVVRPAFIICGIFAVFFAFPGLLSAQTAIIISIIGSLISLCLSTFWLLGLLPDESKHIPPQYELRSWFKSAFPLMVYGSLQIVLSQTSIVMLSTQSNAESVGLFAAAYRFAFLLPFIPYATGYVTGPISARLYANGEKKQLQKILSVAAQGSFLISLIPGLILVFMGGQILSILGPDFSMAKTILVVLTVANLVDIALGNSALLLSMTGQEQIVALVFLIIAAINIGLNAFFIPFFGAEGAAWATLISILLSRLVLALTAVNKLGVNPTIFSRVNFLNLDD